LGKVEGFGTALLYCGVSDKELQEIKNMYMNLQEETE